MKRFIALLLAICMTALALCACGSAKREGTYTLMVYMVGSDLESKHMAASNDISEMLDSGLKLDDVNLLIYTGGTDMWYYDIPCDANATYKLTEDQDGEVSFEQLAQTEELLNMGDSATLASFLNYSCENFPADRYGLICWDHGNGPLIGFGNDIRFDNDKLSAEELKSALDASPFKEDKKLDFIGFDACLMSSIEVADVLKNHAKYMIASQETEPGDGWDYSFLSVLNESFDTPTIAERILESYTAHYEAKRSATFNPDLTIACMDLAEIDAVNEAIDALFGKMTTSIEAGEYYQRAVERSRTRSFGDVPYGNRGMSFDLVDTGSLAQECAASFGTEAAAVQTALKDFVVLNKTNLPDACGVSLYYPYNGTTVYEQLGSEQYKTLSGSENYRSYIEAYTKAWKADWSEQTADGESKTEQREVKTENAMTYTLTDEQRENFGSAHLNIFHSIVTPKGQTEYGCLLNAYPLEPDDKGVITVEANHKIPVVNGTIPMPLSCDANNKGSFEYHDLGAGVSGHMEYDLTDEMININCYTTPDSDEIIIKDIGFSDNSASDVSRSAFGKNSIEPSRWECLDFLMLYNIPTKDDNGNLLPPKYWKSDTVKQNSVRLNDEIRFSMEPIEEALPHEDYYYQIVIKDKQGKRYDGELTKFDNHVETDELTRKTPNGAYTYEVNGFSAKLIKYEGADEDLILPEKIDGLPVTGIDSKAFSTNAFQAKPDYGSGEKETTIASLTIENPDFDFTGADFSGIRTIYLPNGMTEIPARAFENSKRIEEVVIPDTVTSIGYKAFAQNGDVMKRLVLPAGVTHISDGAFFGRRFTEGVSFKGENQSYTVKDGLLLSSDGKILHAVFPGENTAIDLPDGLEEIAPYVHTGGNYTAYDEKGDAVRTDCSLTHLSFPDSLKRIRYDAFYDETLDALNLPDGLEEIGSYAFYDGEWKTTQHSVPTIHLGSKLSFIGETILGNGRYETLTVSEKNRFFAAKDNRLTNKHGDADLSEIALSASDYLDLNKTEHRAYSLATAGMDLSKYDPSDKAEDNKSYEGSDYSLKLTLKKSEEASYQPKGLTGDISLNGTQLSLPCAYNDFSKIKGLTPRDEKEEAKLKEKVTSSATVFYRDQSDNSISIDLRAKSTEPTDVGKCDIPILSLSSLLGKDGLQSCDFSYRNLTGKSSIQDVVGALGSPSSVRIYCSDPQRASVTMDYTDYATYHRLSLEMTYYADSDSTVLRSLYLNWKN